VSQDGAAAQLGRHVQAIHGAAGVVVRGSRVHRVVFLYADRDHLVVGRTAVGGAQRHVPSLAVADGFDQLVAVVVVVVRAPLLLLLLVVFLADRDDSVGRMTVGGAQRHVPSLAVLVIAPLLLLLLLVVGDLDDLARGDGGGSGGGGGGRPFRGRGGPVLHQHDDAAHGRRLVPARRVQHSDGYVHVAAVTVVSSHARQRV